MHTELRISMVQIRTGWALDCQLVSIKSFATMVICTQEPWTGCINGMEVRGFK